MSCEHCVGGIAISPNNRVELGIELHSAKGKLVAYGIDRMGRDISVNAKINYCPMCGEELQRIGK